MDVTNALVSLEGALNSALALMTFVKDENDPVAAGLIGVCAAIQTGMTILEDQILPVPMEEDASCRHPEDQILVRRAGRSEVRICGACNEVIE